VVTLTLNTYSIRLASGPKRVGIPLRGVSGFQGGRGPQTGKFKLLEYWSFCRFSKSCDTMSWQHSSPVS